VTDGGNGADWDHADWIEPRLTGEKGTLLLTDLKWIRATAGWETVKINKSIAGNKLIVNGETFENGIGTHATSIIEYNLPEGYNTFSTFAGLDQECVWNAEGATVQFHVFSQYPTGSVPRDSINIVLDFKELGITGRCEVRDLWAKKDLGVFKDGFTASVREHGTRLLRIHEIR
jgi:hypothetical protein